MDSCPTGDLSGNAFDGKCTAPLAGSGSTSGGTTASWSGSSNASWSGTNTTGNASATGTVIVPIVTDISDNWAKDFISVLIKKGLVNNAKNFRPDDSLTRAEFLKIVGNSAGWDTQSQSGITLTFEDLSTVPWVKGYLQYAVSKKIVSGGKNFRPNDTITRAEVAKILAMSLGLKKQAYKGVFSDVPKTHSLALFVEKMKSEKIFEWQLINEKLIFRPEDNITRAEIAKVVVIAFMLK